MKFDEFLSILFLEGDKTFGSFLINAPDIPNVYNILLLYKFES